MTPSFRPLFPTSATGQEAQPQSAQEILEDLEFESPSTPGVGSSSSPTPYLILNMVSTTDGRATISGRSGPIGNHADRELFHGLRTLVDGVMIGAGTLRTERYNRIVADPVRRQQRLRRGLAEEPLACVVSASLRLAGDIPLLTTAEARVLILTPSSATLPTNAAHVQYIRTQRDGLLDLPAALEELRKRFGVRTLLCEGGPHLNSQLLAAGLVDELFLSLAPKIAGGDSASDHMRILAGAEPLAPVDLDLLSVLENESNLFLRYRVVRRSV